MILNTIKKEMAVTFLRHYVKLYMLKKEISGEAEAIEKILKNLPILSFSEDGAEKIGAAFISKNKPLFTIENLYPANDTEIMDFDALFNVPPTTIEGHAALETCTFVNMFHESDVLKEICNKNEKGLDDAVFALFPKKISWSSIKEKEFSLDFIENNLEKVDWSNICTNQKLPEEFITKYANRVDWSNIAYHQTLSEEFMDYYKEKLNWNYLCQKQEMSEEFMREHADVLSWSSASQYQPMSEKFMVEFSNKVNWDYISQYKELSAAFITAHFENLDTEKIMQYQNIPEELLEAQYSNLYNKLKIKLFSYQGVSAEFCEKHKCDIKSRGSEGATWEHLFDNKKLLHFDFKGTEVYKSLPINEIKAHMSYHKGPIMVKPLNSGMFFRSVFVRNKNKYRLVKTDSGYKNWEKCVTPLQSDLFTIEEMIDLMKTTVILPKVKNES